MAIVSLGSSKPSRQPVIHTVRRLHFIPRQHLQATWVMCFKRGIRGGVGQAAEGGGAG